MKPFTMLRAKKVIGHVSVLLSASVLPFLGSCDHKDLGLEEATKGRLKVVFDWREAPEADPSSMAVYFYDPSGGNPLRYIFQNKTGGYIRIPTGIYNGVSMNADLTDWAVISGTDRIGEIEISTPDAHALSVTGFTTGNIPRHEVAQSERYAVTPGMLWAHRLDGIETPADYKDKTVTFYPEEKVCHYTIDVYDSGDMSLIPEGGIDATLSGMAEGYLTGADTPHEAKVTHPVVLKPDLKTNSLHSEFLTFGDPPSKPNHFVSIYVVRNDGKKWNCNVDVTKQVREATDPHHVHIVLRGLDIPEPLTGGGMSVDPDVEDWETVNITLHM